MQIADPERGKAFVIDVERGQETTHRDGDMRICDVVELEILETCDELPGIGPLDPFSWEMKPRKSARDSTSQCSPRGTTKTGAIAGWKKVLPPTVLLRN